MLCTGRMEGSQTPVPSLRDMFWRCDVLHPGFVRNAADAANCVEKCTFDDRLTALDSHKMQQNRRHCLMGVARIYDWGISNLGS